ncbi:MAG: hypothetical protein ACRDTT_01605 [Pseudonocardiaceae bacterium]
MALAVRATVPIYANEHVLAEAGIHIEEEAEGDEDEVARFKEFLEQVSPEDFKQ